MKPLSPRARSLLDRYRASETPPASSQARAFDNLMQAVGRGVQPRFDVQDTSAGIEGSWFHRVWQQRLGKAIGAALLALPALALAGLAGRAKPPRSSLPRIAPTEALQARPAESASAPMVVATPAAPANADAGASRRRVQKAWPSNKPLRPESARGASEEPTIDGEMRLLNDAQAANLSGDSQRALALLDEYSRRFPAGRLNDLQTVARLVALCNLGQVGLARREAARFQARYPNSPFSERVNRICASKAP